MGGSPIGSAYELPRSRRKTYSDPTYFSDGNGRVRIKMAAALRTASWQAISHSGTPNNQVITGVIKITMIAVRFTLRSMLPSRCQFSINGPKDRCSRNQRFSRVEERANAKAATSRNGVVGNNGNTRPIAPIATDVRPASNQSTLIPESTPPVHHTRTGADKFSRYQKSCPTSRHSSTSHLNSAKLSTIASGWCGWAAVPGKILLIHE